MVSKSLLHYTIIKEVINIGYAPSNEWLAQTLNTKEDEIIKKLYELQDDHGLLLHPNVPKIWVIHPFSLAPTNFFVQSEKGEWWGNCAWCSLGIGALVGGDIRITTTIGGQTKQVELNIINGEFVGRNYYIHFPIPMKKAWDNVIYTCSNMLIFEDAQQVDRWSKEHNIPRGDIQPLSKIWEFSKIWYGGHLDPEWTKWTSKEAQAIFSKFDLNHDIWKLENIDGRF